MAEKKTDLVNFYKDINQEVINKAAVNEEEDFRENTFTELYLDSLVEAAEIDYGDPSYYAAKGIKINGYCIPEDDSVLTLFVTHYENRLNMYELSSEEVHNILELAKGFYIKSVNGYYSSIEEANNAFGIAKHIYDNRKTIQAVNLMLLTNASVSAQYLPTEESDAASFVFHVWDIQRLYHLTVNPNGREKVAFQLKDFGCNGLNCVQIQSPAVEYKDKDGVVQKSGGYTSYFTVFPGEVLFKIYEQFNARLLERNVRTFLQARNTVNKGLKNTILNEPEMFLAYNNGISATAEAVDVDNSKENSCVITGLTDFQIVNGGQTTASIFNTCLKNRLPLSRINIQAKITVLDDQEQMETVVPKISQYANSQNIVQKADFSTNDDFHVRLEELSRNIWAPSKDGEEKQSKWFYERARGQYADTRSRAKSAKQFDSIYPKKQYFDKLQLARYCNVWDQFPYVASKGGQANFGDFTLRMQKEHKNLIPDEQYYHELIAKGIIYQSTNQIVKSQDFQGFWSAITDYTAAYLSFTTGKRIDLEKIWRNQAISDSLKVDIENISKAIYDYLIANAKGRNIQQWCKQKNCWEDIKSDINISISKESEKDLIQKLNGISGANRSGSTNYTNPENLLIKDLFQVDAEIWGSISAWGKETNSLKPVARGIAFSLAKQKRTGKMMTYKQAKQGINILNTAYEMGFVKDAQIKAIIDRYPDEIA